MFIKSNCMPKSITILQVVDELFASIFATSKKQRKIRSGTFWNKFGFERRTKERVEAVKRALANREIDVNLEDSYFGTEKRGELIVLRSLVTSLPIKIAKADRKPFLPQNLMI